MKRFADHSSVRTIAIVGGGASGTLVAVRLLQAAAGPLRLVVIEPSERLGLGVAYGTTCRSHLLNVPAAGMSAYPETPCHFADWLRSNIDSKLTPDCFAPRLIYGEYLAEQLRQARRGAARGLSFEHVRNRVLGASCRDGGALLELHDGGRIAARHVVLALGNAPSSNPLRNHDGGELCSPWSDYGSHVPGKEAPLLLIDSGLTAVDVILALDDGGHRGPIHVVSRHGHWPLLHGPAAALRSFMSADELPDSVADITAMLRLEARSIVEDGGSWRSVIDGLRPYTNEIWQRLSLIERRRFLRHLRPYWDIHRHRMAPEVARRIARLRCAGRVVLHGGRVTSVVSAPGGGLRVGIRLRAGDETRTFAVGQIINCTGPESDYRKIDQPLIGDLLEQGAAAPDPLGLGLPTSDDGALIQRDGSASRFFFTLGPPRKGTLLESVAMPEIRTQAAALAQLLGQ